MGYTNCLVTDILQNIFFCVQHKNEVNTGLEELQVEKMMTEYDFLGGELCLKLCQSQTISST